MRSRCAALSCAATCSKPKNQGVTKIKATRSLRARAEDRVGQRCPALRILNSYYINSDSGYTFYEVICIDPSNPAVRRDPRINWICDPVHKRRETHGLTGAGRQSRGLLAKGHGAANLRPSRRASWKRRNAKVFRRYR